MDFANHILKENSQSDQPHPQEDYRLGFAWHLYRSSTSNIRPGSGILPTCLSESRLHKCLGRSAIGACPHVENMVVFPNGIVAILTLA